MSGLEPRGTIVFWVKEGGKGVAVTRWGDSQEYLGGVEVGVGVGVGENV